MRTKLFKSLAVTGAIAFTAGVMGACSSGEKSIPTIDLIGNMNHEDVGDLDDIFEVVDVISPEFTDSTMLRRPHVCGFSNGKIYLSDEDYTSNRLMTFDVKTGKCLASFDHTGQGPGEYKFYYDAIFQGTPGYWTGLDTFYRRVTKYTADGELIESWPEVPILSLRPDGEGWIAVDNDLSRGHEDPIRLIRFDAKFNPTDTIETNLPDDPFAMPRLYSSPDGPQFFVQDTLYAFPDGKTPTPIFAFNTGHLKAPMNMTGIEAWKVRDKYLNYFFNRFGHYILVDYMYDGKGLNQIFDIRNGELAYSRSCRIDPETLKIIDGETGLILTVDGEKSRWFFMNSIDDYVFLKQSAEDVDEETSNTKIIRLRPKDR